jgi:hypothetical protein
VKKLKLFVGLVAVVAACGGGTPEPTTGFTILSQLPAPHDTSGSKLLRDLGETGSTRTYVGNEHNPDLLDYDGNPLVVDTMITAVKFCVGDKRSDEAGGLSDSPPAPLRFVRNGVAYDEWNLLLSGIGFHGIANFKKPNPYAHFVFGPVDSNGVDQSATPDHPREGLNWVPMRVAVPAADWNGRLLLSIGGGSNPGTATWFGATHIIPGSGIYRLKKGWAICVYQHMGLVRNQQNPWAADNSYWSPGRNVNTMGWAMARARIDANGNETKIHMVKVRHPADSPGTSAKPDKEGIYVSAFADATTARNVANLVKNLLEDRRGSRPVTTIFAGGSGTGNCASEINHGRVVAAVSLSSNNNEVVRHPQVDSNGLTARTGGNFNKPYDPSSGLVYNGFLVIAGGSGGGSAANVQSTGDVNAMVPDPEFPITAPVIHLNGVWDSPSIATGSLRWAHRLGVALQAESVHPSVDTDLNSSFRVYHLQAINHWLTGQFYADGLDGGSLSYEGGAGGIGLNAVGRGRRLLYTTELGPFPSSPASTHFSVLETGYSKPRTEAHVARMLAHLASWAEDAQAPPISHLDAFMMGNASTTTLLPNLALAPPVCQNGWLDPVCWGSNGPVLEDSLIKRVGSGSYAFAELPQKMSLKSVDAIQFLKSSNALQFTTQRIHPPEDAARVGLFIVTRNRTLLTPFTAQELRDGYTDPNGNEYAGYEDEDDFIDQIRDAAQDLVARGLFDQELADLLVSQVEQMPYPR